MQRIAIKEDIAANACHVRRNVHACQRTAAVECIVTNACHTGGKAHARQGAAAIERLVPDAGHTLRKANARQRIAVVEQLVTEGGHTTLNGCTLQRIAVSEGSAAKAGHGCRNAHACKRAAALKRLITNLGHSVWNIHTCQGAAVGKRVSTDAGDAAWNCHTCQTAADSEGIVSDASQPRRQNYSGNVGAVGSPGHGIIIEIQHVAAALYGQCAAIGIKAPAQLVTAASGVGIRRLRRFSERDKGECILLCIALGGRTGIAVDGKAGQAVITILFRVPVPSERHIPNIRHAVRNSYARHRVTVQKRTLADTFHASWNAHFLQCAAEVERIAADARHTARNCDCRQGTALFKRRVADFFYTVRNAHTCQTRAGKKSAGTNQGHAIRNMHILQRTALAEGIVADCRQPIWKTDSSNLGAVGIPGDVIGIVIKSRHSTTSLDGQRAAIGIKAPCQLITATAGVVVRPGGQGQLRQHGAHQRCYQQKGENSLLHD